MIGDAEDSLRVGLVLRKQQRHVSFAVEIAIAQIWFERFDDARSRSAGNLLQTRPIHTAFPRPLVAKPERRQNVQFGLLRAAIVDADLDQNVFRRLFGILDEHVEVAILIEYARVEQFVFEFIASAAAARLDKIAIGECRLRILVEVLHVRMGRRAVEIEVIFLDVLAVVALAVGQSEQAFLENRVLAVPKGQRKAEPLPIVGDAGQAILAPAIGARAGLIVGEVIPGIAPFAIVFANGSPLAFAEVGTPFLPRGNGRTGLVQSNLLNQASHFGIRLSLTRENENVIAMSWRRYQF